jgi:hypothetical protein
MSSNNYNNNNNICSGSSVAEIDRNQIMYENLDLHISRISARTTPEHISRTFYEMSIADVEYVDIVATKDPETKAVLYYSAFVHLLRWGPELFPAHEFDSKKVFKIFLGRYSSDPAEKYWNLYLNKNPLPRTRVNVHQLAASTEKLFDNAELLAATVELQKSEIETQKSEIKAQNAKIYALECELKRCEDKFDAKIETLMALLTSNNKTSTKSPERTNNLLEIPSVQAFPTINQSSLRRLNTADDDLPIYEKEIAPPVMSRSKSICTPDYSTWQPSLIPGDVKFVMPDDPLTTVYEHEHEYKNIPKMIRSSTLCSADFAHPSLVSAKVLKAEQEMQNHPAYNNNLIIPSRQYTVAPPVSENESA